MRINPAHTILAALAFTILSVPMLTMSGCSVWRDRPRLRKQEISMNEPVDQVPPIQIQSLNAHHMLVMQSPHSGWSIAIDRNERVAIGTRLFITVRRPDPSFMYPQAIVEKNLLTNIPSSTTLEVFVRLLDAHEKTKGKGYGLLTPVDRFED